METRLGKSFYERDVLEICPELLGKTLIRKINDETVVRMTITEIEAYRGEEDLACHASKGRTARTDVMYREGGLLYVYFVYGVHWMLNIVTGKPGVSQAILVRGLDGCTGPGRVTSLLKIERSFYGEDLCKSDRIWIEDNSVSTAFSVSKRIGIDYAGENWKNKPWRYISL